ncbi:type II toxin-antitoxin system RelE/ParE family toxin [Rhizobium sp. NPDC090275]|uniref:type II toxin-antitoxin system RelE/ParE family toxin n=1 Tax=Rhizobium sp. NPDC090275 TaxID=3364498 RepID=UPI000DDC6145
MTELFELLATHPHSGVPYATDKYSVRIVPRGNYVVVYRVRDSDVVILRVIHAARDWPKQMR